MNVKDLKALIADMPDTAQILIWIGQDEGNGVEDREAVDADDEAYVTKDDDNGVYAVHLGATIVIPEALRGN